MPRRRPTDAPGALHHVTVRGAGQQPIYLDDVDRERHLARMAFAVARFELVLHAYCQMTNHVHWLIQTPNANLSAAMHVLNLSTAREFNRRHGRSGHLYEAPYSATPVTRDSHLAEVSRYIELNPVRAGICALPEEWAWSSYRATAGLARRPRFLTTDLVLGQFASNRERAEELYREFVADGSPYASLAGLLALAP